VILCPQHKSRVTLSRQFVTAVWCTPRLKGRTSGPGSACSISARALKGHARHPQTALIPAAVVGYTGIAVPAHVVERELVIKLHGTAAHRARLDRLRTRTAELACIPSRSKVSPRAGELLLCLLGVAAGA
jgi:hypothetical protein